MWGNQLWFAKSEIRCHCPPQKWPIRDRPRPRRTGPGLTRSRKWKPTRAPTSRRPTRAGGPRRRRGRPWALRTRGGTTPLWAATTRTAARSSSGKRAPTTGAAANPSPPGGPSGRCWTWTRSWANWSSGGSSISSWTARATAKLPRRSERTAKTGGRQRGAEMTASRSVWWPSTRTNSGTRRRATARWSQRAEPTNRGAAGWGEAPRRCCGATPGPSRGPSPATRAATDSAAAPPTRTRPASTASLAKIRGPRQTVRSRGRRLQPLTLSLRRQRRAAGFIGCEEVKSFSIMSVGAFPRSLEQHRTRKSGDGNR